LRCLNNYINAPAIRENIQSYIVSPALGDLAGVCGALALAQSQSEFLPGE
jgi:fructokinase